MASNTAGSRGSVQEFHLAHACPLCNGCVNLTQMRCTRCGVSLERPRGPKLYRTIVADPPWDYPRGFALGPGHGDQRKPLKDGWGKAKTLAPRPLPYSPLSVQEIAEMPVSDLAASSARVFLWTTNRYLPESFGIVERWGFPYRQTLVWHKTDANLAGGIAPNSAEFIVVGARGAPGINVRWPSAVVALARPGNAPHSTKPDLFLDLIEQVSPGPYLELFARRARFGWDYWGDESLETVEMASGP